jgi:hypothetical protein
LHTRNVGQDIGATGCKLNTKSLAWCDPEREERKNMKDKRRIQNTDELRPEYDFGYSKAVRGKCYG